MTGCGIGKRVTIPAPGTDTSPPIIYAAMDTIIEGTHDFSKSDRVLLYPPIKNFIMEISASDSGGVSKLELYDSWDSPNRTLLREVKGDRGYPLDLLLLLYEIKSYKPGEEHSFGIIAEDFSGNHAEKGPLFVKARALPSDLFRYDNPGTIIEIKGVLTRKPGGDQFGYVGYNAYDPDFHYLFIADKEYAHLADTLGTDREGGQFHPEQDGWSSDCEAAKEAGLSPRGYEGCKKIAGPDGKVPPPEGWITIESTPGVYWPWDPHKDAFGNDLNIGDHIRMIGRLRYDHEEIPVNGDYYGVEKESLKMKLKDCWDTGFTANAFKSRPSGHAEIHPIDLVEKIAPLPQDAETIIRLSACAFNYLWIKTAENTKILDLNISPAAPRPSGFVASVVEEIDGMFTGCRSIKEHTLARSPEGDRVHVHVRVEGESWWGGFGKFRAKYRLWWAAPNEAVLQKDSGGCGP